MTSSSSRQFWSIPIDTAPRVRQLVGAALEPLLGSPKKTATFGGALQKTLPQTALGKADNVASDSESGDADWLFYGHQQSPRVVLSTNQPHAVYDDYEFNQDLGRQLIRVSDLALSANLRWSGSGAVRVRCPLPGTSAELRIAIDSSGRIGLSELWIDGSAVAESAGGDPALPGGQARLLVGYWDGRLVCNVGERGVIQHDVHSDSRPATAPSARFGLAAVGFSELKVTNLSIWRDLHYYVPQESALVTDARGALPTCGALG